MNKQTSIALHLARVMGIETWEVRFPPRSEPVTKLHFTQDGETHEWKPHTDLSQWAECVLWAAMNGCWPDVMATRVSYDAIESGWIGYVPHDGTLEGIQAATLEAIARATSWEESK